MRMVVSNSAWKSKLSYEDVRDLVLGEEVRRKDADETSYAALNLEEKGRVQARDELWEGHI
jgi:hypothetical protein